jgi:hypothetical protein
MSDIHPLKRPRSAGKGLTALAVATASVIVLAGPVATRPASGTIRSKAPVQPRASVTAAACREPTVPRWFASTLDKAVRVSGDLPHKWAKAAYFARIVCWQDTSFDGGITGGTGSSR